MMYSNLFNHLNEDLFAAPDKKEVKQRKSDRLAIFKQQYDALNPGSIVTVEYDDRFYYAKVLKKYTSLKVLVSLSLDEGLTFSEEGQRLCNVKNIKLVSNEEFAAYLKSMIAKWQKALDSLHV